jgi:hypothetical protein
LRSCSAIASRSTRARFAIAAGTAGRDPGALPGNLGAEQRQRAGAARLDVDGAKRLGRCGHLLADGGERGIVQRAMVVVDELAPQRRRHPLRGQFHLIERAHRIGVVRNVEQKHDAVGGGQPQRFGGERVGAEILQRVQHGAGLLVRVFETSARGEPEPCRLGDAAQAGARDRAGLGLLHGKSDLHVELRAKAVERLGARQLAVDLRWTERGRQRRREVANDAHERVELRARDRAVAIGQQKGSDDFAEPARRIAREPLPVGPRIGSPEPAKRLADSRMKTRGNRTDGDRRGGLQRNQALDLVVGHRRLSCARGRACRRQAGRRRTSALIAHRKRVRHRVRRRRVTGPVVTQPRRCRNDLERGLERAADFIAGTKRDRGIAGGRRRSAGRERRLHALRRAGRLRIACGRAPGFPLQSPLLPAVVHDDADDQQRAGDDQYDLQ